MTRDELTEIQERVPKVRVEDRLVEYALDLVEATRDHDHLEVGVSPRGTISFIRAAQAAAMLAGRSFVTPDDLKGLFLPVCAHRVMSKSYLHDGHSVSAEQILREILANVSVPE